jgi:spermidine/putrescine transport system ATP-binding protein
LSKAKRAASSKTAIDIQSVTKIFRGETDVHALDNVSVKIGENEFFTLLGPSGCGKTTLLRLIAGFDHPTDGTILLHGSDISHLPPNKRPVNTVFQNYALFPHMTVAGNIGFGLEMLGWAKDKVAGTVDEMLRLVRMEELKNRRTSEISGGQQQRVALARALAPHPKVLLLDEPLSALDFKLRKEMQIELKRLQNETGITFVFVTHDQEEALTMSDRVAVMNQGRILQVASPREIYDHPAERFVADFIGESNFLAAKLTKVTGNIGSVELAGIKFKATLPEGNLKPGNVSVLVRPEHAHLTPNSRSKSKLTGQIENIVYFGTDTHYYLKMANGEPFTVRVQNSPSDKGKFANGDSIDLVIDQNALQILRD